MVTITTRIDDELAKKFKGLCEQERRTMSNKILVLIEEYVREREREEKQRTH